MTSRPASHMVSEKIVRPIRPTVLGLRTSYELDPITFLPFSIEAAIVVPGPVDERAFEGALARTLSEYPLYAGRMRRPRVEDENWKVTLEESTGVPLTIIDDSESTQTAESDVVVQAPFTLARKVDYRHYWDVENDEPLLRVTLTRFTALGHTAIGLSSSHSVGDGFVVLEFMRHLSAIYTGVDPSAHTVTYDLPPLDPSSIRDFASIPTPSMKHTLAVGTVPALLDSTITEPAVRIDFRLSAEQLADLRRGVLKLSEEGTEPVKLSLQDCLVALMSVCIARAEGDTVPRRVSTFVNHRAIGSTPGDAVCNALIEAVTGFLPTPLVVYNVAAQIRAAMLKCKDPAYAAASASIRGAQFQRATDAGLAFDFSPEPGYLSINSTRPFDWTAAHFGFPGRAKFYHTVLNAPRYAKIFTPNPTERSDGREWRNNRGAAEVTFYLRQEHKPAFEQELRDECRRLGVQGEVEILGIL